MALAASSPAQPTSAATLIRCHDCDLLQDVPPLPRRGAIACARCGAGLITAKPERLERAFVLYLTALILLIIANSFPFLTMKIEGLEQSSHLLSGAIDLFGQGMWEVSVVVILFVFVAPLVKIIIGLLVVGPLAYGRGFPRAEALYRLFDRLHPWAMTEIFLLGVLVAYTKLVDLATVELGPSLFGFLGLIVALIAADATVEPNQVWERLRRAPRLAPPDSCPAPPAGWLPYVPAHRRAADGRTRQPCRDALPALRLTTAPAQAGKPGAHSSTADHRGAALHPGQRLSGDDAECPRQRRT